MATCRAKSSELKWGFVMRLKLAGLLVLAGTGILMGGCVYVPPSPSSPGYYAPLAAAPPIVVAPAPVYVAPPYGYRPYYRPYYRYGYGY